VPIRENYLAICRLCLKRDLAEALLFKKLDSSLGMSNVEWKWIEHQEFDKHVLEIIIKNSFS
jgi:hypothetical protein